MGLLAGRHTGRVRSRRSYRLRFNAFTFAFRPRFVALFVRALSRFVRALSRLVRALSRLVRALSRLVRASGAGSIMPLVFSRRLGGFPPPGVGVRHGLPERRGRACGWHPFFPAEAFACWYSASFPATRMVRRVRACVNGQSGGAIRKHLATASGQIGAVHFWPAPASARFWPIIFQPRKWPCCMGQSLPRNDQSSVRASLFRA